MPPDPYAGEVEAMSVSEDGNSLRLPANIAFSRLKDTMNTPPIDLWRPSAPVLSATSSPTALLGSFIG